MCTIAPERRSRMPGTRSEFSRTDARRFRFSVSSHSSSGMTRPSLWGRAPPALWTRMSTPPSRSRAAVASASVPAGVRTSAGTEPPPPVPGPSPTWRS
ncbi:hypothetical protein SVIOM342S_00840 [Streptomyces violaceorubidus]